MAGKLLPVAIEVLKEKVIARISRRFSDKFFKLLFFTFPYPFPNPNP